MTLLADARQLVAELLDLRDRISANEPDRLPAVEAALIHARAVVRLCEGNAGPWERALVAAKLMDAYELVGGLLGGVS